MTIANSENRAKRVAIGVVLGAILISGCARNPKSDAETYLGSLKLFNYPACYEMLSHQDRLDRTLEQFLTEIPMAPDVSREWFRAIEAKMNYTVGDATVDGERAIVTVKVTMPDLALWERMLDAEQNAKQPLEKRAQESLQQNSFPVVTYDDAVVMVRGRDGWKVMADFPSKESAAKLHKHAVELYHEYDYDGAIAAYNDLIAELGKVQATGNRGLAFRYERERQMVENAKAQSTEAQAYLTKVLLTNVDMKMSAAQVPGVFGQITNGGDKPLDQVRIAVTFYSGKGGRRKAVFREEHTPVATPIEFTNFSRDVTPFAPNQTRDFGFKLTAPAEIQRTAKGDVTVTTVAFSQFGVAAASAPRAAGTGAGSPGGPAPVPAVAPQAPPPPMPRS